MHGVVRVIQVGSRNTDEVECVMRLGWSFIQKKTTQVVMLLKLCLNDFTPHANSVLSLVFVSCNLVGWLLHAKTMCEDTIFNRSRFTRLQVNEHNGKPIFLNHLSIHHNQH
jgi:hypothetical protein